MTKRNITIVGIMLILIAITIIISIGRWQVRVASTVVREPVVLRVDNAVVNQANLMRSVQHELTDEVGAPVNTLEVNQAVAAGERLVAQGEKGVELAVVLRAAVPRVQQV